MEPNNTNTQKKTNCFIYLRRSQDREDRQQLSLDKQDTQVKQVILRNNLLPIYLPPEERSAKAPGRPVFNDMMDKIESGGARYIAVWALSRLSRNPVDGGRVIYAMDTGHLLAIHTPSRTYRNTPDDKAMLAIELAFAKKNNDVLSVQVKEGFVEKRTHGQYPGPAPIGYKNAIIRPGERNIAPDPETAPKVIECINMASKGMWTLDDIWRRAVDIGLKSRKGSPISKQTINDMLQRRTYSGVFKYSGKPEWHQGTYEPLISVELYDKVQHAMGWVRGPRENKPSTTSGRFYAFKGLMLCGTCKFNVTAYTKPKKLADGSETEYQYYTCTKKNKKIACKEAQIGSSKLEKQIKSSLMDYQLSKVDAKACQSWVQELFESHTARRNQHKPLWVLEQKKARNTLDTLDEKLEQGTITDERYKTRAEKHEETLARTKRLIEGSVSDADAWLELSNEVFSRAVNIGGVFEEANDEERRELMKYVGSNWTLSNKKVALTPREPLDALYKNNSDTIWRARPDSNRRSPP